MSNKAGRHRSCGVLVRAIAFIALTLNQINFIEWSVNDLTPRAGSAYVPQVYGYSSGHLARRNSQGAGGYYLVRGACLSKHFTVDFSLDDGLVNIAGRHKTRQATTATGWPFAMYRSPNELLLGGRRVTVYVVSPQRKHLQP